MSRCATNVRQGRHGLDATGAAGRLLGATLARNVTPCLTRGTPDWRAIDWARPWFAPYRELGPRAIDHLERGAGVADALNALRDAPNLRFVAARDAGNVAYESFIARTRSVPTRDNLHDFFNGLG